MHNAAEMFSFGPNPMRAKNAWASSTCLLYGHWSAVLISRNHSITSLVSFLKKLKKRPYPVPEYIDPCFRENKPKTLALWACFHENAGL